MMRQSTLSVVAPCEIRSPPRGLFLSIPPCTMSSNPLVHYYIPCTRNSSTNSAVFVFKKKSPVSSAITSCTVGWFIVPQEGLTPTWCQSAPRGSSGMSSFSPSCALEHKQHKQGQPGLAHMVEPHCTLHCSNQGYNNPKVTTT